MCKVGYDWNIDLRLFIPNIKPFYKLNTIDRHGFTIPEVFRNDIIKYRMNVKNSSCSGQPVYFTMDKRFRRWLKPGSLAWLAFLIDEQIVLRCMNGFILPACCNSEMKFIGLEVSYPYG
ncbi:hypothetical protein D3C77_658240 [compost metagenome]